jgi:pimeloyl-ACP methyl ester carboxylesterase
MPYTSNSFGTFYSLNKVNKDSPIVFVHGVGLNNEIWKPQIDFFKKYNTLAYDLLGHGKTPLKRLKLTFNIFSRQLLNLINELKFKKIHLVGFSLGALIARHFASKHNDRLCSLIIHGSIYKRTEEQKRVVINRLHVAKHNRPISKKSSITRWLTEDFISKNPEIYKEIYSMLENNNNKNFLKSYELFTHYNDDDDDMIKKINVNTLITTGEHDIRSTTIMAKNLNKVIKNSKFVEIKNGKHLCSIECADDVNMTFKKFIDENNA